VEVVRGITIKGLETPVKEVVSLETETDYYFVCSY